MLRVHLAWTVSLCALLGWESNSWKCLGLIHQTLPGDHEWKQLLSSISSSLEHFWQPWLEYGVVGVEVVGMWLCDWSDSLMSLSRWKGNLIQRGSGQRERGCDRRVGGLNSCVRALNTSPPVFLIQTPNCSQLPTSSCFKLSAIAITAFPFFFLSPALPSSLLQNSTQLPLQKLQSLWV